MYLLMSIIPMFALIPVGIYFYFFFNRILQCFNIPQMISVIISIIIAILFVAPARSVWGVWTVVVYYMLAFCLAMDLIHWILRNNDIQLFNQIYRLGIIPILCIVITMSYGYYTMKDVNKQSYTVETSKTLSKDYSFVFISDLHFGNTMNKEELQTYCEQISNENVDFVLLGGDIVDEQTTNQEMHDAFATLSTIKTNYGIYYVYGNHDEAHYVATPPFTTEELAQTITDSNIQVLSDNNVVINDDITIIGRNDRSSIDRLSSNELVQGTNSDDFILMLDHQPVDLVSNDSLGVDLQISGHTHGGQIFPVGLISDVLNFGEMNYGYRQMDHMQVIVSSGIAGWGYPIRLGSSSEYVVVNIERK